MKLRQLSTIHKFNYSPKRNSFVELDSSTLSRVLS
jgi:hypothetical protein